MDSSHHPYLFSRRAQNLNSSAIREILKVTVRPEVISFAGGLPSPDGFPVDTMRDAFDRVLDTAGKATLQYGPTEGHEPLRQWVANDLSRNGVQVEVDEVLNVSGSQQAQDMLGKLFIEPGSAVLIEAPSYLGAIQSFSGYEPTYETVPSDQGGLDPQALTTARADGARFIYVLPNFQNPTGLTLSRERREALAKRCAELDVPIIEDDPYGALRYAGEPQPSLLEVGSRVGATVIRLGSFSKVLAPGLRIAYIVAPKPSSSTLVKCTQSTSFRLATLTQTAVYEAVKDSFLAAHLGAVRDLYKQPGGSMLQAMDTYFPASVRWAR